MIVVRCPKCEKEVSVRSKAFEVWHRCTHNRNNLTQFIPVDELKNAS